MSSYTLKIANSNEVLYKVKTRYQLPHFLCENPLPDNDKMKWLNLIFTYQPQPHLVQKVWSENLISYDDKIPSHPILYVELILQVVLIG